jgi:hypothetical protein
MVFGDDRIVSYRRGGKPDTPSIVMFCLRRSGMTAYVEIYHYTIQIMRVRSLVVDDISRVAGQYRG